MGVTVIQPGDNKFGDVSWDDIGGYESQKRQIEDTILLYLRHPEIYESITKATRLREDSCWPKAVLFEGPPGTGKTTSAKILAQEVNLPLVYISQE